MSEQNLAEVVGRIRLCLDRVNVCPATLGVVSRQRGDYGPAVSRPLVQACAATGKQLRHEHARHGPH
jgi:hypothetical protein